MKTFESLPYFCNTIAPLVIGAIAAGASTALKGYSAITSKDRQAALMEKQYDLEKKYQLGMSRYMYNKYNSPAAQRRSMEAAGINPFVDGSSVSPQIQTANSPSPDFQQPADPYGEIGSALQSGAVALKQMEVLDSQKELNEANAAKLRGDTKDPNETRESQTLQNESLRLNNNLLRLNIVNAEIDRDQKQLDYDLNSALFDTNVAFGKAKLFRINADINEVNQRIAESVSRENLNFASTAEKEQAIRESASRIILNMAQSALARTRAQWEGKLSEAQINKLGAEVTKLTASANLDDVRSLLTSWQTTSEVERYNGLVYDNWQKHLKQNLDQWKYSVDSDGNSVDGGSGGNLVYFIENLANLFHLGVNLSKH